MDAERFLEAQEGTYRQALAELRRGQKDTHWMWFVFPQLHGLGHSSTASYYGLKGLAEARAYLAHPVLGARLVEAVGAAMESGERDPVALFGTVDALKFRSSLTLFEAAADDPELFRAALERFYGGERHGRTLEMIGRG